MRTFLFGATSERSRCGTQATKEVPIEKTLQMLMVAVLFSCALTAGAGSGQGCDKELACLKALFRSLFFVLWLRPLWYPVLSRSIAGAYICCWANH